MKEKIGVLGNNLNTLLYGSRCEITIRLMHDDNVLLVEQSDN